MQGNLAKTLYIAMIAVLITSEGMNYSIIAPFFPIEARHKNTPDSMIGLVIGSFSFSSCITAILISKIVSTQLQFFFVISGCIIAGVSLVCFGSLEFSSPGNSFLYMSMSCRIINGIASAMLWSSAYPALCSIKEEWTAILAPLIEFSVGFGVIIGPPIGSLLYSIWGYAVTFFIIGGFQIVLSLTVLFIKFFSSDTTKNKNEPNSTISMRTLLKLSKSYQMLLVSVPFILCSSMVGLIDTVLAPYLINNLSMTSDTNGLIFAIQAASYAIANICTLPLPRLGFSGILYAIGPSLTAIGGLGFCLQAYFKFLQSLVYVCFCLILISFGSSAVIMNCYLVYDKVILKLNVEGTGNVKLISATWINILFTLGATVGATFFGGIYYEHFGIFPTFFTISALSTIIFIVNIFLLHSLGLLQKIYFGEDPNVNDAVPLLEGEEFCEGQLN